MSFYRKNWLSKSLISIFYEYHILYHSIGILELSAILVQILASFHYYILISNKRIVNKINLLDKISYKLLSLFIFCTSFFLYLYIYFDCTIQSSELHITDEYENVTLLTKFIYRCESNTEYQNSLLKIIYEIFIFVFRDGISLIIMIVLNIMIYIKVSNNIKIKKTLHNNQVSTIQLDTSTLNGTLNKNLQEKLSKVEIKLTIMVFLCNLNLIFGRFPILIVFISKNIVDFSDDWYNFNTFANVCVYVSYLNRFFLFYAFNEKFKRIVWQYLKFYFT